MNSIAAVSVVIILLAGECEMASQHAKTAEEFQSALDQATAGDIITLLPIEYSGNFHINSSGTEEKEISIVGTQSADIELSKNTMLTSENGTIFSLVGDYITLAKVSLSNGDVGVQVNGSHNIVKDMNIPVGSGKGLVINGEGNKVITINLQSAESGLIIESGNGNEISGAILSSLTILGDTSGGSITKSTVNGNLLIKGDKYTLDTVIVQGSVTIEGCDSEVTKSIFQGSSNIASCNNYGSMTNLIMSF